MYKALHPLEPICYLQDCLFLPIRSSKEGMLWIPLHQTVTVFRPTAFYGVCFKTPGTCNFRSQLFHQQNGLTHSSHCVYFSYLLSRCSCRIPPLICQFIIMPVSENDSYYSETSSQYWESEKNTLDLGILWLDKQICTSLVYDLHLMNNKDLVHKHQFQVSYGCVVKMLPRLTLSIIKHSHTRKQTCLRLVLGFAACFFPIHLLLLNKASF